jgi:predicted SPOUT superfamily RNA methylase MTH1
MFSACRTNPKHRHLLVVFGGVAGLEAAVGADPELLDRGLTPASVSDLFDHWINVLPQQGSRTIRTEEAVWLGLMSIRGLVEQNI